MSDKDARYYAESDIAQNKESEELKKYFVLFDIDAVPCAIKLDKLRFEIANLLTKVCLILIHSHTNPLQYPPNSGMRLNGSTATSRMKSLRKISTCKKKMCRMCSFLVY